MRDIVELPEDGNDLGLADSIAPKAGNICAVQLGTLEYALDFGVDLKYFLESDLQFQNASFKAYLVQRLTEQNVNVSSVVEVLETLLQRLTFNVGDVSANVKGYIR